MDEPMQDAQHEQPVNDDEVRMHNKIINEEYKIWKKNAVYLYDIMYARALEWPTLTIQWLPDIQAIPGRNLSTHRLILGTHTSEQAQNYLQIAHLDYPDKPRANPSDYDPDREEIGGHGAAKQRMEFVIDQKINHPGEINKARYMPQNPNIIATMCPDGRALIFDRTKHPLQPRNNTIDAQVELVGHKSEGFGLAWNKNNEGQLVTGSTDTTVKLWDIKDFQKSDKKLAPTRNFTHHSAVVNDVQFHPSGKHLFGSVSDDKTFAFVDVRSPGNARPAIRIEDVHSDAINTLAFHPKFDMLVATGSADKTVAILDMRFPEGAKINAFEGHKDSVTKVDWHPHDGGILASSGDDRRVIFWDLSRTGMEQTPEDAEDGPPEMLFMHGGHTARISDFSWNLNDPWVMCSVAEDNLLQAWRAARPLVETLPPGTRRREASPSQ